MLSVRRHRPFKPVRTLRSGQRCRRLIRIRTQLRKTSFIFTFFMVQVRGCAKFRTGVHLGFGVRLKKKWSSSDQLAHVPMGLTLESPPRQRVTFWEERHLMNTCGTRFANLIAEISPVEISETTLQDENTHFGGVSHGALRSRTPK